MCCGAIAGTVGQFIASPADLVKIRMINSLNATSNNTTTSFI